MCEGLSLPGHDQVFQVILVLGKFGKAFNVFEFGEFWVGIYLLLFWEKKCWNIPPGEPVRPLMPCETAAFPYPTYLKNCSGMFEFHAAA